MAVRNGTHGLSSESVTTEGLRTTVCEQYRSGQKPTLTVYQMDKNIYTRFFSSLVWRHSTEKWRASRGQISQLNQKFQHDDIHNSIIILPRGLVKVVF